jgi:hypothetical protein
MDDGTFLALSAASAWRDVTAESRVPGQPAAFNAPIPIPLPSGRTHWKPGEELGLPLLYDKAGCPARYRIWRQDDASGRPTALYALARVEDYVAFAHYKWSPTRGTWLAEHVTVVPSEDHPSDLPPARRK